MRKLMDEQEIKKEAYNESSYEKGLNYWRTNKVQEKGYWQIPGRRLHISVLGTRYYNISVCFSDTGELESYRCSCPAFDAFGGKACKHVVAVLKQLQNEMAELEQKAEQQREELTNGVLNFFSERNITTSKKELHLEIFYSLDQRSNGSFFSCLELKIGEQRSYVVKNIKNFLGAWEKKQCLVFGKNFMFDPAVHNFSAFDLQLLDLLGDMYAQEQLIGRLNFYSNSGETVFRGKQVYLTDAILKKFFQLYEARTFPAIIIREMLDVTVSKEALPLTFQIRQQEEELLLNLGRGGHYLPLTEDWHWVYCRKKIYCLTEEQQDYLPTVLQAILQNEAKALVFKKNKQEQLVSELLPVLNKISKVQVEASLSKRLLLRELSSKIYLDWEKQDLKLKIEYDYGEKIINPLVGQYASSDGKILIREVEKERHLENVLEAFSFRVKKDAFYLSEEEEIFQFIYDALPRLQQEAEIFYSESFKKLQIKDVSNFSGGIKLRKNSDLLEFTFDHPEISKQEFVAIFQALKEKKKYYRLPDGSFLSLADEKLEHFRKLLDGLHIQDKELLQDKMVLPKYRALYLDQFLRENKLPIERNLAFKEMVQNIKEPEDMEFEVPVALNPILRDYQKRGFKWLKTLASYGLGGILADDMGLGKTLQVIAFLLSERAKIDVPSLVIAPTSLVYNWQDEVQKFAPELKVLSISGSQKIRREQFEQFTQADLVVTSYALLKRDIEFYEHILFQYCFLDEAQQIKNPTTVNAKAVKMIRAQGYFALTGTPMENSLTELWSIFDFLLPGYLLSHAKFQKKYERPIMKADDRQAFIDLSYQIKPFILRRLKKEVLKELPAKIESRISVELPDEQKKYYLAYLMQVRGELAEEIQDKGFPKSQIKILAALTRLRQLCCHPVLFLPNYTGVSGKLEVLKELVGDALANEHRILIFSQFTKMLGLIKKHLEEQGIACFYLDGATKAEQRGGLVKRFNGGEGQVFLISLKAGGLGLNLTGADTVIHFDPWWNPAVEEQATDRAYRIGQDKVVQVFKLITVGTIEEKIFQLQERKKNMIESIIEPGENLISKLSQAELEALFLVEDK